MNAQIAQHLNLAQNLILEVQEWANVLWVRFVGGCRFVSKKVVEMKSSLKGSEKQVAWGESVRQKLIAEGERQLAFLQNKPNLDDNKKNIQEHALKALKNYSGHAQNLIQISRYSWRTYWSSTQDSSKMAVYARNIFNNNQQD